MSRPGIESGPPLWEAITLEKSHSNSLLIAIRNIYIWACDMAPPSAYGYMNIHTWAAIECRPNSCMCQRCINLTHIVPLVWITSESPLWRDLRLDQGYPHPKLEVPRLTCPGRESNSGPPRWEASTLQLVDSYSEHLQTYEPAKIFCFPFYWKKNYSHHQSPWTWT